MADKIQFRRDTAARWAEVNPILLSGEIGLVTDSVNKYKLGDGVHAWNELPLQGFNGTLVDIPGTDSVSAMSQKGATDLVSEYNVSINNNNTEYTFAQAVALVPASLQKGGLTIKYIDSTTHEYAIKRLMSSTWNITESNWQGIDNEPTVGSNNLVKSSGVNSYEIKAEFGGISNSGGLLISTIRCRSLPLYFYKSGEIKIGISFPSSLIVHSYYLYKNETPIQRYAEGFNISNGVISFTASEEFNNIRVSFRHSDNSEITQEEVNVCKFYISYKDAIHYNENTSNTIKKEINDLNNQIQEDVTLIENEYFEFGGISNNGSLVHNTIRCRSQRTPISGSPGNIDFNLHIASTLTFKSANAYLGETFVKNISSNLSYSDGVLTVVYDGTYDNFIISYCHSDNSEISQSEVQQCYFTLDTNIKQKVIDIQEEISDIQEDVSDIRGEIYVEEQVQFEFGGISNTGSLQTNNIRVRTKPVYFKQIEGTITLQYSKASNLVTTNSVRWGYLGNTPIRSLDDSTFEDGKFSFICDGTFDNIRFSLKHSDNSEISQSELEQCAVQTVANSIKKINNNIIEIKEEIDIIEDELINPFKDLKYAALGDSITYGYIPRNYTGYPGQLDSYAKLAAQKLEMTFVNYGVSGSTLAAKPSNPTANSPMSRRYNNMPNDADIISVMGGTNDIRKGISLGTFSDNTDGTYYGALHVILGGLYKKYLIDQGTTIGKKKKIFICTPPKLLASSGNVDGGTGTLVDMDAWCAAIKEVAAYYSIPVLDFQNLSGINPHLNQIIHGTVEGYTDWYNPYITDGTHPTQEGAEIMADVLVGFLKGLK